MKNKKNKTEKERFPNILLMSSKKARSENK